MIKNLFTIPNILTIIRISLIPIFMISFYGAWKFNYIASSVIFILASITDYLDGYLARKLRQESNFGRFLDPVADKLIVVVALLLLVEQQSSYWFTIPATIIICREIAISALREWMADLGARHNAAVSWLGKLKTAFQMFAVCLLLTIPKHFTNLQWVAYLCLYFAVILTIWSMLLYLWQSRKSF